ncbi:MAG TPA: ATP-dependent DNA ligase [Gemmatimonadales bacterium]
MKAFARLYTELDETTATNEKVAALVRYFRSAAAADAAWAVHFLSGRRPKRLVRSGDLRAWATEAAGIPEWLFDESYQAVGDLAETIALLLPDVDHAPDPADDDSLRAWVEERLLPLRELDPAGQRLALLAAWSELDGRERYVWNKLITGAFRVGASQRLVVRALAEVSGVADEVVAHRMMGAWEPDASFYLRLVATGTEDADRSRPYPFALAYPLESAPDELGPVTEWQAEWKWDGIRAQVVRRAGSAWLWSRGEDLLTGRFPEVEQSAPFLPDGTVLDGELLGWIDGAPLPFAQMQRRIGRKTLGRKILEEVPVVLLAYDLLERDGADVRAEPLARRRAALEGIVRSLPGGAAILLSPVVPAAAWDELVAARLAAREHNAEGLMLKRLDSAYGVGRKRGDWWKWKVDPFAIDAVLIYAQPGSGRRAGLFTDYTFGVWDGDRLVPVAKAYSGLTDGEIAKVDAFIRRNTLDRHGPVRVVKPELVFELAFEGIQRSTRHRGGIAVRFPRMARWRTDKRAEDADTIETVRALL